jgi:hypothetical protein
MQTQNMLPETISEKILGIDKQIDVLKKSKHNWVCIKNDSDTTATVKIQCIQNIELIEKQIDVLEKSKKEWEQKK